MMHSDSPTTGALLTIGGAATADHTVPVEVLARTLDGMQQTVWLLAAAREQKPVQQRFRPDDELRRYYTLECGLSQAGSYALPLALVTEQRAFGSTPLLEQIHQLFAAVETEEWDVVQHLLPDSKYRDRALREVRKFLPKAGDRWYVAYSTADLRAVMLRPQATRVIDAWLRAPVAEDTITTIIGELIAIQFDEHKLIVRYPPTNREVDCSYIAALEDTIIQQRRELIQVTGQFVLDAQGHPKRLTDVTRIEPVDLSPMTFDVVEYDGRTLVLEPLLTLTPTLDEETKQLYVVIDDQLGIDAFAATREEVADTVFDQLFMLWDMYANEQPERLTGDAQELREALRARLKEL